MVEEPSTDRGPSRATPPTSEQRAMGTPRTLLVTVTPTREHGRLRPPLGVPTCPRVGPGGSASANMNEWSFAGEIKSWWDAELANQPDWELTRCEIETQTEGTHKRSDIVLRGP